MNGAVGFAVFVIVIYLAYVVAGIGYARGWWMQDRCPECGGTTAHTIGCSQR